MHHRLTPDALDDRQRFRDAYGEGNCRCHQSAPCGSCTHDGHPHNQEENPDAWEVCDAAELQGSNGVVRCATCTTTGGCDAQCANLPTGIDSEGGSHD